jgi:hypothetical protein
MLRLAVVLLVLANAGFFAWSRGLLLPLGMGPASPSEPHRIEQQLRPNDIRIGGAEAPRRTGTASTAARQPT